MKKIIIIALSTVIAVSMFSRCGGSASIKSEKDSVSYIIGLDLGNMVKGFDSTLNVDVIAQGIKDVMDNNPKITPEDAQAFMRDYQFVRLPARAKEAENAFFEEIQKGNKNLQKTESGILYEIIEAGDAESKVTDDVDFVKVKYEGKLKDGRVFDSTAERGDTAQLLPLGRLIQGWQEGMKLVGKGGKIKLYIPADLGYGPRGQGIIGANEPLIFDVELIDFSSMEEENK